MPSATRFSNRRYCTVFTPPLAMTPPVSAFPKNQVNYNLQNMTPSEFHIQNSSSEFHKNQVNYNLQNMTHSEFLEIIRYLHWCKQQHSPATVASAQIYLVAAEEEADETGRPTREALRWFFRAAWSREEPGAEPPPPRIRPVLRAVAVEREIPPLAQKDLGAVVRFDFLVSWDFRHLTNVGRESGFNAVNLLQGYRPWFVEISRHVQDAPATSDNRQFGDAPVRRGPTAMPLTPRRDGLVLLS
jgi:hypothetical protein